MTTAIIVVAAYIAAQIISDIASLKIILVGGLSMDAGTLIYPLTFTLRDLVHKVLGRKNARIIVITAAVINICMAAIFWLISRLPYDPSAGVQPDWDAVLAPVWRIVFASIIAEVIAELVDTEIYHLWVTRVTERFEWARVLVSNAVSLPLDSLIFVWVAFGGVFPNEVVWAIFGANVAVKAVVTIFSMPLIYLVKPKAVSAAEGET
jgi:uncharacterized integral membrane protein (TIGR00697 family)